MSNDVSTNASVYNTVYADENGEWTLDVREGHFTSGLYEVVAENESGGTDTSLLFVSENSSVTTSSETISHQPESVSTGEPGGVSIPWLIIGFIAATYIAYKVGAKVKSKAKAKVEVPVRR